MADGMAEGEAKGQALLRGLAVRAGPRVASRPVSLWRRIKARRAGLFVASSWMLAVVGYELLRVDSHPLPPPIPTASVSAVLRSPRSGRLVELDVAAADIVTAGAVVATVDVPGDGETVLHAPLTGRVCGAMPTAGAWLQAGIPVLSLCSTEGGGEVPVHPAQVSALVE